MTRNPVILRRLLVSLLSAATILTVAQTFRSENASSAGDDPTPKEIMLWPNGAPGSEGKTGKEVVRVTPQWDQRISNVHSPSLTPYLPAGQTQTPRTAVIIMPGGGHRELCVDYEGYNLAQWLSARGIAAFVLKYRLAREPGSTYTVDDHALADTMRAIRFVRSRAQEWNIAPSRIGVLGFSAGGELAALSAIRFDGGNKDATDPIERANSRPDFQALIYPGSSGRIVPTKDSPPAFLACGYKDRPDIAQGLAEVYLKFKGVGVPAELHIYAGAGHGFGVRATNHEAVGTWPARFQEWLADSGFLSEKQLSAFYSFAPLRETL